MGHEEEHVTNALTDLCKVQGVTCVIQVGAEDGHEANLIRSATGCRAVAIDGDSRCKPGSDDIEYHHSLIGATNCKMPFFVHINSGLSSELERDNWSSKGATKIQQRRLDTFCDYHGIEPDALIIDTEGTSLDVLEGCGRYLEGIKLIYAECQPKATVGGMRTLNEVDGFLSARGFTQHAGLPSYEVGASQGNYTWVRP